MLITNIELFTPNSFSKEAIIREKLIINWGVIVRHKIFIVKMLFLDLIMNYFDG